MFVGQNEVPTREGNLIDETGSIKITLWREYTSINSNTTYDFRELVKIRYGSTVQLQTVHNSTYTVSDEPVEDYDPALPGTK